MADLTSYTVIAFDERDPEHAAHVQGDFHSLGEVRGWISTMQKANPSWVRFDVEDASGNEVRESRWKNA